VLSAQLAQTTTEDPPQGERAPLVVKRKRHYTRKG